MSQEPNPPRWAEAMLRLSLRPCDRESISGDLLEEYRVGQRPAHGALRANAWYTTHALSVLWQLIQPWALAMFVPSILLCLTVFRPGHHAPNFHPDPTFLLWMTRGFLYGSVMPAPGVSLFDGLIYFWVAYHAFQRTRLIGAGLVTAAATSVVGTTVLFAVAATITPDLVVAVAVNPLLLLIVSVYFLVPLVYAVALGAFAGVVGRWLTPSRRETTQNHRASGHDLSRPIA